MRKMVMPLHKLSDYSILKTKQVLSIILLSLLSSLPYAQANFEREADGWTILTPSGSSAVFYVSSSGGNDANDGRSPDAAVKTVSRGQSLLRDNSNDFLLFNRGDTWNEGFGNFRTGGFSVDKPLVISSYGTGARPLFNTGNSTAVRMGDHSYATSHNGGYNNIVFKGLHFHADTYNGTGGAAGFHIDFAGQNLLFEDMYIEGYSNNLVVQAIGSTMGSNIQLRRSVIADSYALRSPSTWLIPRENGTTDNGYTGGQFTQGIYASRLDGLLIEENVFDHNGWNESVLGADRTIYNHNLYIQTDNTADVTVRGNIIANGSANGVQMRSGGILENNLLVGNGTGAFVAGAGGRAESNVFLHSSGDEQWALDTNHGGSGPRNWGLDMQNISGSKAYFNLLLHTPEGQRPLTGLAGVSNEGNLIYQWGNTMLSYDPSVYTLPFPAPDRTVASYDDFIGGSGSVESFLAGARTLSSGNWDPKYFATTANDYFFAGFLEPVVLLGDFDDNKIVDGDDLVLWKAGFGMQSGAQLSDGDANGDNAVNGADFLLWQRNYGSHEKMSAAVSVPEPNTVWLVLSAILIQICTFRCCTSYRLKSILSIAARNRRFLLFALLLIGFGSDPYGSRFANAKSPVKPRLILDCDTGNEFDDLYAITRMLKQDQFEVIGLSSALWLQFQQPSAKKILHQDTAKAVEESQRDNEALLKLLGRTDLPALLGAPKPFGRPWPSEISKASSAAQFIIKQAKATPKGEHLIVVCTGAFTNLASAIKLAPEITTKIRAYIIGFKYDANTNVWSKNEYNVRGDLDAADYLLNQKDLELHIMPATVARKVVFSRDDSHEKQLLMGPAGQYLTNKWMTKQPKKTNWKMWDLALVEALSRPDLATESLVDTPPENVRRQVWMYDSIDASAMQNDFWKAVIPNKHK